MTRSKGSLPPESRLLAGSVERLHAGLGDAHQALVLKPQEIVNSMIKQY